MFTSSLSALLRVLIATLLAAGLIGWAQAPSDATVVPLSEASAAPESDRLLQDAQHPERVPNSEGERIKLPVGPHHRIHRNDAWHTNQLGEVTPYVSEVVQIETGLNRQTATGEWVEASDELEIQGNQVLSRKARHGVKIAGQLNRIGAIEVTGPDGKTLSFTPIGLIYYDPVSGKSAVIAQLKKKVTGRKNGGNEMIFQDCFEGVNVDIRYRNSKSRFEQDVIINQQLPDASEYGLDPATVRLQVATEFFTYPEPNKRKASRRDIASDDKWAKAVDPELVDENLSFGDLKINEGEILGPDPERRSPKTTLSSKEFHKTADGRTILFEVIPMQNAVGLFQGLPAPAPTPDGGPRGAALPGKFHLPRISNPVPDDERIVAAVDYTPKGVVMDFPITVVSQASLTLAGDTTYLVTGAIEVNNLVLEGGAVIKSTKPASYNGPYTWIRVSDGTFTSRTSPFRPAVFTAFEDNTVGETIPNSVGITNTGVPSGFYGTRNLVFAGMPGGVVLENCRFRYSRESIWALAPFTVRHSQFYNCGFALISTDNDSIIENCLVTATQAVNSYQPPGYTFAGPWGPTLVAINEASTPHVHAVRQCTLRGLSDLTWTDSTVAFTNLWRNNLIVGVGGTTGYVNKVADYYSASDQPALFQQVGLGLHYLAAGSPHANVAGLDANIGADLLASLRQKTTAPPIPVSVATSQSYYPRGIGDTNALDRGYHYPVIDYTLSDQQYYPPSGSDVATFTFGGGVAVGIYGSVGLTLNNGEILLSEGTPLLPNRFFRLNLVQEALPTASNWYTGTEWLLGTAWGTRGMRLRFTEFTALAGNPTVRAIFDERHQYPFPAGMESWFQEFNNPSTLWVQDCSFAGVSFTLPMSAGTCHVNMFINNVFDRAPLGLYKYNPNTFNTVSVSLQNNLFYRGSLTLVHPNTNIQSGGELKNNVFDGTVFPAAFNPVTNITLSNNGYVYPTSAPGFAESTRTLAYSFQYANGPLGPWYQASTDFVNKGSGSAVIANLAFHTTRADQIREATSLLDLGFHYPALNSGALWDTDNNGSPDCLANLTGSSGVPITLNWISPVHHQTNSGVVTFQTSVTGPAISRIEYYKCTEFLGSNTAAPYTFNWCPNASGADLFWVRAVGTDGSFWFSPPRIVTYSCFGTQPPTISWESPLAGTTWPISPTNVFLKAIASAGAGNGTITQVEFSTGSTLIAQVPLPQITNAYTYSWLDRTNGTYPLKAKVYTSTGATAEATTTLVLNELPKIAWVDPTRSASLPAPGNVNLKVWAVNGGAGGPPAKVEFFKFKPGAHTLLGTLTGPTSSGTNYLLNWNALSEGQHSVFARATDNLGATRDTDLRLIDVGARPTVTIVSPTNGTTLKAYSSPTIGVEASIAGGQIAYVDFYAGTNFLGRDTTVGTNGFGAANFYELELSGLAPGTYDFTAHAFDASNPPKKKTSGVVHVVVAPPLPSPGNGEWDFQFGNVPGFRTDSQKGASVEYDSNGTLHFTGGYLSPSGYTTKLLKFSNCTWSEAFGGQEGSGLYAAKYYKGNMWYGGGGNFIGGLSFNFARSSGTTMSPAGAELDLAGVGGALCTGGWSWEFGAGIMTILPWNGDILIGGRFDGAISDADPTVFDTSISNIAALRGTDSNWSKVGIGDLNGTVRALAVYNGELYAGGYFTFGPQANSSYLARLVNNSWQPVGTGVNGPVLALKVYAGQLYVGGEFTTAGNISDVNCIAVWNGSKWSGVAGGVFDGGAGQPGQCNQPTRICGIANHGETLYVTGHFRTAGSGTGAVSARHIAQATWDSVERRWTWSPMGAGLAGGTGDFGWVGTETCGYSLAIRDFTSNAGYEVVVAGNFTEAGGAPAKYVARWIVGGEIAAGEKCTPSSSSVTLITPADGATSFSSVGTFTASVNLPSNTTHTIASVLFCVDGDQGTTGTLQFGSSDIWYATAANPLAPGTHTVRAVATCNDGSAFSGKTVTFTVPQDSSTIVFADSFEVLSRNVATNLLVLANHSGGANLRVTSTTIFADPYGGSSLGSASVAPQGTHIIFQPRPYSFGRCVVNYVAKDAVGVNSGIAIVQVKSPPVVSIDSPTDGAVLPSLAVTSILGSAKDYDGSISNVVLWVDGSPIATVNTTPGFSFPWIPSGPGHHVLTVVAKDNDGYTTTSAPVTVKILGSETNLVAKISSLQNSQTNYSSLPVTDYPVIPDGILSLQGLAYAIIAGQPNRSTNTTSFRVMLQPTYQSAANGVSPSYILTKGPDWAQGFVGGGDTNGALGTFDLSQIENGVYDLTLTVRSQRYELSDSVTVSLRNNLKLGNFSFSEQDLVIPVNGIPLTVVRKYDTLGGQGGDFGRCWSMTINDMDVRLDEDRTSTPVVVFNGADPGEGGVPMFSLRTGGGRNVSLMLPDGRRGDFLFRPRFSAFPEKPVAWAEWQSPPGVSARLVVAGTQPGDESNAKTINFSANGINKPVWSNGEARTPFEAYDIPGFDLILKDSTKFELRRDPDYGTSTSADWVTYDANGSGLLVPVSPYSNPLKLRNIVQPSGDRVEIKADGVSHYLGSSTSPTRKITFIRDDRGRISALTDPLGNANLPSVRYLYNDDKYVLVQVLRLVDRTTGLYATNRYYYDHAQYPSYLTRIVDARGITVARNEYDATGRLTAVVDALGRTNRFIHDFANHVEKTVDRLGYTNSLVYDTRGNVLVITNALNEVRYMGYDSLNNKVAETNYLGGAPVVTSWQYDTNRNLLTATIDSLNNTNRFEYNDLYQLIKQTDTRGNDTQMGYDSGQVATVSDSLGSIQSNTFANELLSTSTDGVGTLTVLTYDALRQVQSTIVKAANGSTNAISATTYDDNGNTKTSTLYRAGASGLIPDLTTYYYDAQGRVTHTIGPDSFTNRVVYNEAGMTLETYDPYNRRTQFVYNELGQRIQTIYPDTNIVELSYYDAEGRVTNSVDRLNRSTRTEYDQLGRVKKVIFAFGTANVTSNQTFYDSLGRISKTIDARGIITTNVYDLAGRRTSVVNAWNTTVAQTNSYRYDAAGSVTNMLDALGRSTDYEYDQRGRLVRTYAPALTVGGPRLVSTVVYDAAGRRTMETSAAGLIKAFGYDGAGRLIAVTNGLGNWAGYASATNWARFEYDWAGNMVAQTDALGRTNCFKYDAMGRRIWSKMPGGQTNGFGYDAVGNLILSTNADNVVISHGYDEFNRLKWRKSAGILVLTNNYTASGRLARRVDEAGTNTWVYDSRDRVITNTTPVGTLSYSYDANGNQLTLKSGLSNGVDLSFGYDELNRLINSTDNRLSTANKGTSYKYDWVGNLTELDQRPAGIKTQYAYDARNRLTNLSTTNGPGTVLGSFAYSPNILGNRTSLTESVGGVARTYTWSYDALQRLLGETHVSGGITSSLGYGFDLVGNRTNRTGSLGSMTATNWLFDLNDWFYSGAVTTNLSPYFDAKGNTKVFGTTTNSYDWANRLTNGTTVSSIVYDAEGNRIKKVAGGTTTWYLVATVNPTGYPQVVEEFTGSSPGTSTLSRVYGYGLDLLHQRQMPGNTPNFYGYDGQGSVRFLVGTNSTITDTYVYDSYGNLVSSTGSTSNNYRYTGEQWDADLGMYYLRARYYQPSVGRFWTRDTYEGDSSDPLSLHRYLYTQGNPVNWVDPSGHETLKTKIGKEVHKKLGEIFTGNGTIPLRFSGPSIATIGGKLKLPIPDGLQVLFPDLLDAGKKEIYEIKPLTAYGIATGYFQAIGYQSLLNQIDPSGGWHLGSTWTPPNFIILTSGVAYITPVVGGVIYYEAMTIQDIAKRGARTVRQSDEGRLQQMTGISSVISLLGGF